MARFSADGAYESFPSAGVAKAFAFEINVVNLKAPKLQIPVVADDALKDLVLMTGRPQAFIS
jgi:hypothetical protein